MFRVLAYILFALLVVIVVVVASVPVDAGLGRGRLAALTNETIPADPSAATADYAAVDVRAYVARPPQSAGPRPAVIMIHEFWGLQSSLLGKADALASEGYVVVVPDTYRGAVTNWLPRAIYLSATTPTPRVNVDLDSVFAWLATQPDVDPSRIMVMGFCYGGGKALRYSLHNGNVAATGVFYGSLISDPATLAALPGPVLGIFGAQDNRPSPDDVAAFQSGLQAAGIPHRITIYPGVGHAFLTDMASIRQDPTQAAAWREFLDFLAATFGA